MSESQSNNMTNTTQNSTKTNDSSYQSNPEETDTTTANTEQLKHTFQNETNQRFRSEHFISIAIAISNLFAFAIGGLLPNLIYWSLGSVGIISFIGILILVNDGSKDPNFEKGEMRKAIAGSFFIFYFVVIGLFVSSGFLPQETPQIQSIIEQLMTPLTYLTGAIGAYYFGARSFEKFLGK